MEQTVSNILSDASAIYQHIAEGQDQENDINDAIEATEAIKESGTFRQENYHSERGRQLAASLLKNVTGVDVFASQGIRMESNTAASNEAAEDVVDEVAVAYWGGLKQLFNNTWARYKEWYHVITDAADALIEKANKAKTAAGLINGRPTEASFDFKDFRGVITDNDQVTATSVQQGLKTIEKLLAQTLSNRKVSEFENMIKTAEKAIEAFVKSDTLTTPDSSWVERFNGVYRPGVGIATNPLTDQKLFDQIVYDGQNAEYQQTVPLLSGCAVIYSSVKPTSTLELGYKLGLINAFVVDLIGDDNPLKNKQHIPVQTLYGEQMQDCCETVVAICEHVGFFEKAWQRRDAFMSSTLDKLESTVAAFKDKGESVSSHKDKIFSESLRASLAAIRRSNVFNASVINLGLKAANSAVNYCEGSMQLYKAQ